MSTIHKQLVTDEEGRPVGVLIPYEEWLRIEQQLSGAAAAHGIEQLRRHEGMVHLSEDPVAYQRRLRDEWRDGGPLRSRLETVHEKENYQI